MCYRFYLVVLMLLLSLAGFSQSSNWLSTIDLNVSVGYSDRIDLYTDKDGNHIIVQKSNQLVYYLFSATGTQIRTSVRDNNVSEYPRLSRIVGWEGYLYIIYKEGNKIKTQRSTNGGANWSATAVDEVNMNNSTSNGMDAWTDANGVHLVFSEDDPNASFKTWYQRNQHGFSDWIEQKEVTDEANVSGGFPSVTASPIRVLVGFTSGDTQDPTYNYGIPRTRERWYSTWLYSHLLFDDNAARSMVIANSDKFHGFYYDYVAGWGNYHYNLYYRNRSFGSNSWSSAELIEDYADPDYSAVDMSVSADDKLHILYGSYDGIYNVWDGNWGTGYTITGEYDIYSQRIAANSNDIYVIWNNASTIKMRQRDFTPLAPTNLYVSGENGDHPQLNWDINNEADLDYYIVYRDDNIWPFDPSVIGTTTATTFTDESGIIGGPNQLTVTYAVTAVDYSENESGYSNIVSVDLGQKTPHQNIEIISSEKENVPTSLTLLPNYPNPFNPSTTIQFGLIDSGPVELSVYNLSGQIISTLINGYMEKGYHQATWNGTDQQGKPVSSGIYIYELKAGGQRFVKKMMLIK